MMIKPILANKLGRNVLSAAVLTTSVLLANNQKPNAQTMPPRSVHQTEVFDKSTAQALQNVTVAVGTFSFEHNKKLDKLYLHNCESLNLQKNKRSSLKSIYNVYGTFGATIELQREIDKSFIEQTMNSYLEHFLLTDADREKANNIFSKFNEWQDDVFYADLCKKELEMYEKQEYPSAELAIEFIDKHINNKKFFLSEDKEIYKNSSNTFLRKQQNKNSIQAKSDLLAHKVHLLNILAFKNYLIKDSNLPQKELFSYYFTQEFINGESSILP